MTVVLITEWLSTRASASLAPDRARPSSRFLTRLFPITGLDSSEQVQLERIVGPRLKVQRGQSIFLPGTLCSSLYAIYLGSFKSYQLTRSGGQQIFDFYFPGQILGLDALGLDFHHCGAIALEDSEVLAIPVCSLLELFAAMPELMAHFHFLMQQEICHMQQTLLMLGRMHAEQRLALFLRFIASEQSVRGYSSRSLRLSMMREDIANHLGLSSECVSRMLARFQKEGLIHVANREIEILNAPGLANIAGG